MQVSELDALLILIHTPYLGSIKIRGLLRHFGSAIATLHASAKEITSIPEIGHKGIPEWGLWKNNDAWKRDRALIEECGVEIIPFTSPQYPKWLLDTPDYPVLLYVKGTILPS